MVLFINFLYGAGLPFLFMSTFVTLGLIYYVDKLLLLKFFRKPDHFDERMQETVRNVMIFILIIHCPFAIWTYGEPDVFGS